MERWEDEPEGEPVEIGADIARFGSDKTVFAPRRGHKVLPLTEYSKQDTMETAGQLVIAHRETRATSIKVDVIGIGAGVYDRAKELKLPVSAINVAESAQEPERFLNLRSELWWNLRELLDPNPAMNPNPVALPPDDELLADLSSVKYRIDSRGRIVVEPKEETKKRLGRSPDRADAVILAFAPTLEIKQDPAAVSLLRGIKVYG